MSETTILDNLNKEVNFSDNLWIQEDGNTGMGVQFRLFSAAVVSKVRVRLYRRRLERIQWTYRTYFCSILWKRTQTNFETKMTMPKAWWLKASTQLAAKKSQAMKKAQ